MDKLSLLAVFAHPGVESCGPGAALAMYASRGVEVSLVTVTRGEGGTCDDPKCPDYRPTSREQFGLIRMEELECSAKTLGISRWLVLDYPDGGLARCNRRALEEDLAGWVRSVRPQVVVTCYPEGQEGHLDHDTVARVTARAYLGAGHARRFPEQLEKGLSPWQPLKLYYCVPPDPDLAAEVDPRFPLATVDVSAFAEVKVRAMRCHKSQNECSQGFAEVVRSKPHWTESFCLAHSRVPLPDMEDDLFDGIRPEASCCGGGWR